MPLTPPPSQVPLAPEGMPDATWKTWLNNLYQWVSDNMSKDPYLEIPAGNVNGHTSVNKFGANGTLGTSSTETVWDGSSAYTFPAGATITHIRAAVDSAATQGLQVEVQGLDTNWALSTVTHTLDGADSITEVALTDAGVNLRRVFRMKVVDSTAADQNIWVGATGMAAGTASGIIVSGNNQTLMAIYTVPASKTAYMTNYYGTLNRASGGGSTVGVQFKLWVIDNASSYVKQIKHVAGVDSAANSQWRHNFRPYFKVTEKSDIYIDATNLSGSVTGDVSAGFDLILVDD